MLRQAMFESFAGFDDFLVYLGVSLAYLAVFVAIYSVLDIRDE